MSSVRFEQQANIGIITIDNPPINLADDALFSAFEKVLDDVDASDVRALLMQAAGDHFGCGVNVNTTFVGVSSKGARQFSAKDSRFARGWKA
jgi:enoyl-CoA hydratase/carnithine racemase